MDKTKKRILLGAGLGAAALLVLWMIFRPSPLTVEIAAAVRGEMLVTIDGEGKTRSHDRYVVTAPVSGKMSRLTLHEGDPILHGQIITGIDPAPQRPVAPAPGDEERLSVYAYKVFAPAAGRVSRIFQPNESIVQAGAPILEISKSGRLEIVVDVLSTDAAQIRTGALMLVENWGGAKTLRARVRTIEPQAFTKISALGVEEQRVNVVADFIEGGAENLGDAYRVETRIIVWESENVLKIPSSALFRSGEKWSVFVADGGRARQREVAVGHRSAAEAEIRQGLEEGETVILHPPNQIADGARITTR